MKLLQPKLRAGFSLVELFVVIGVVSVLGTILLTCVAKAKAKTREIVCSSNQRQIGLGLTIFALTTDYYPLGIEGEDGQGSKAMIGKTAADAALWYQKILPFMSANFQVWNCPSNDRAFDFLAQPPLAVPNTNHPLVTRDPVWACWDIGFSYGYNTMGCQSLPGRFLNLGMGMTWNMYVKPEQIRGPSAMVAVSDTQSDFVDDYRVGFVFGSFPAKRHQEGSNSLRCDGHVEFAKWEKLMANRSFWNNDYAPHPGI